MKVLCTDYIDEPWINTRIEASPMMSNAISDLTGVTWDLIGVS